MPHVPFVTGILLNFCLAGNLLSTTTCLRSSMKLGRCELFECLNIVMCALLTFRWSNIFFSNFVPLSYSLNHFNFLCCTLLCFASEMRALIGQFLFRKLKNLSLLFCVFDPHPCIDLNTIRFSRMVYYLIHDRIVCIIEFFAWLFCWFLLNVWLTTNSLHFWEHTKYPQWVCSSVLDVRIEFSMFDV